MGVRVRLMASSGASCGDGAGAHGDKPPRALGGGGQRLWRGCGVWMEVKETMDKATGWAVDGAHIQFKTKCSFQKVDEWTKQNCPSFQKGKQNGFFSSKPLIWVEWNWSSM